MCIGMLNDFSRYYNTVSYMHSLNPLTKILASLIYILMVCLSSCFSVLFSLFLILIFIIVLSNIPITNFLKPIYSMKVLLLFILVINLICGLSIYDSLIIFFKVILIVIYSSFLIYTTTTRDLANGFCSLLFPLSIFNVPIKKISMAIALSLSFIPGMFSETNKIIKSQMCRGFNYKDGNFKDKILGIKSIFVPMFVMAFRRADRVSDILEINNFSFNNNNIKGFRWCVIDSYMILCHLTIFVFVLIKEVVL